MAKRIKITEQQLSVVVNYLKENEDKELLEEGIKEWMLVGLMTLGSMAGIKAQSGSVSPDHIKAAQMMQSKLDSGDKEVVKYFDKADIDLNRENLQKLLRVDDAKVDTFKTKYLGTAKQKIKQGYVLKTVDVTNDTLIKQLPKGSSIDTSFTVDLSGNLFDEGKFDLNQETVSELDKVLKYIKMNGGKIKSVVIESSTDMQRISKELDKDLFDKIKVTGNKGLSMLRYFKLKQYLTTTGGVDKNVIDNIPDAIRKGNIKWEQGKGVPGAATEQDPSERKVKVTIYAVYDVQDIPGVSTVEEAVETVYYVLLMEGEEHGTYKPDGGGNSSSSSSKKSSCKVDLKKIGSLACPKKF